MEKFIIQLPIIILTLLFIYIVYQFIKQDIELKRPFTLKIDTDTYIGPVSEDTNIRNKQNK